MAFTVYRPEDWSDALPKIGEIIANSIKERYERPRQEFIQALTTSAQLGTQLSEEDFAKMAPNAHAAGMYSSYAGSLSRLIRTAKLQDLTAVAQHTALTGAAIPPETWASIHGYTPEQMLPTGPGGREYKEYATMVSGIIARVKSADAAQALQVRAAQEGMRIAAARLNLDQAQQQYMVMQFMAHYEQQERFHTMDRELQQSYMNLQAQRFAIETIMKQQELGIALAGLVPDPMQMALEYGKAVSEIMKNLEKADSDTRKAMEPLIRSGNRMMVETLAGVDPDTGVKGNPLNLGYRSDDLVEMYGYTKQEVDELRSVYALNPQPGPEGKFFRPPVGEPAPAPPATPAPTGGGGIREGLRTGGTFLHNIVFGPRGQRPHGAGEELLRPPAAAAGAVSGVFGEAPGIPAPGTPNYRGETVPEVLPPEPSPAMSPPPAAGGAAPTYGIGGRAETARKTIISFDQMRQAIGPMLERMGAFEVPGTQTERRTTTTPVMPPRIDIFSAMAGVPFQDPTTGNWVVWETDEGGQRRLVPYSPAR